MSEAWYTAKELAGLPGMPGTDRGVRDWGRKGVIQGRKRARGKGQEYAFESLPTETRTELALRSQPEAKAGAEAARREVVAQEVDERQTWRSRQQSLALTAAMPAKAQARMDARLAILDAADRLHREAGLGRRGAIEEVVRRYNAGELEVGEAVRTVLGADISVASVYRWRNTLAKQGAAALAGRYKRSAKHRALIEQQPDLLAFCEAFVGHYPDSQATQLDQAIRARFGNRDDIDLPSRRAVQRWLKHYRAANAEVLCRIRNPDEWKGRYMAATGSASEGVERLNQLWELDSTPGDVMLTDGRHSLIGVIDVATRRARLLVSKTSKATAVASLTRRALLDWGVPEIAKTDNGSDYTSHHMRRVFQGLGIEQQTCEPFQPWQKPHIERFFRSFQHDLVELLPGYIGHSVADRQAIEERKAFAERLFKKDGEVQVEMSAAEFQRFADDWIERLYHHRAHEGLGGRTPFEATQAAPGVPRRVEDERALDVLLAEAPGTGMRTVRKKGVHLDNGLYDAPELGEIRGEEVHVRYDETDYGRIYVYHQGVFLCIAEDPSVSGVSRQEVAGEVKRRQRKNVEAARRRYQELAKEHNVHDIAQEIVAGATTDEQVTEFPRPAATHTTDDLEAARDAAEAREQIDRESEPAPVDETAVARVTELLREEQTRDETGEDRFRRWIDLHEREQAGETLSEFEVQWKARYEDTSEFRGRHLIYEEFGADAFGGARSG
ncbi:Mu transposase C-terminal domain-containing protein [Arhodomonas sp. AD133]|uniref:Mu transposase C-terminal domain-containing protein n=1 Tax=Arhodomonas sp. AD133 TaxID=3415009 RepID=UPI003EBD3AD6